MYIVIATTLLIGIFLGGSYAMAAATGRLSGRIVRSRGFRKLARENFQDSSTVRTALRHLEIDALD